MRHAAFVALALFGLAPALADAQIVPSGANAPNVVNTANGIPQVNVRKPSGAGVSVNTYSQFDVRSNGAILNNSPVITGTQLAGQIAGNPNFAPNDAAKIIVNQVNSNNPSQLRGYVEVAGQKTAAVVIANSSGLVVDGGGFINTSKGILTTGNPVIDGSGNLTGFNVTGGVIAVQGAGLNGSNVDEVDLLARAVQANAAIHAHTLNVTTGSNSIEYASLNPTPIAGSGAAPGVSIDVSQLGGMYANRITLAGTENGVGVANAGAIAAQAGDLTLTSSGQLVQTGRMTASGSMGINAAGIANSGIAYAQHNTAINSAGALQNSGTLAAQQDVTVNAGSVVSTGLLGAGINSDGTPGSSGNLRVTAAGLLSATGQTVAPGTVTLHGVTLDLSGAQISAGSALALTASGGNLRLASANATAGSTFAASAGGTLDTRNARLGSTGAMQLSGTQITNANGEAVSGSTLNVQTAGALDNEQGILQAAGQETIGASAVVNSAGKILSLNGDGLALNVTGALTNGAGGVIGGNGNVGLTAGSIANAGQVSALGDATLNAQTIDNDGGSVTAGGTLAARAVGALSNVQGQLSGTDVAVSGASLNNTSGQVDGAQVSVSTSGDLVNRAGTIQQSGMADQTISAGGALDGTGGTIASNAQNLTVTAASITNDNGKIQHAGSGALAIHTPGALSNVAGQIATNGSLAARSASLDDTRGVLSAQLSANVYATNGMINSNGGQIYGATALSATTQGDFDNAGGSVQSGGNVAIDAGGTLGNANGVISANGANGTLTVTAFSIDNSLGTLTNSGAGNTVVSAATDVRNSGGVLGGNGDVDVHAQTLVNNAGAQLVAAGTANLNVTNRADNTNGLIYSATALNLDEAGATFINDSGRIEGSEDVSIQVASMSNAGGNVNANHDIRMSGALAGGGAMTAGHDLTLALQGDFANETTSALHADNNLTLGVAGTLTNAARVEAGNALTVNAANVVNAAGADLNSKATAVNASNGIANAGIIEGDTVTTNSASLNNTGALIGNNVIVNAGDVNNEGAQALIAGARFVGIYAANSLTNADGALIYSAGSMELARDNARDSTGLLAHQTGTITNSAATIEAAGNIDVAATTLTNQRTGVQTEAGTPVTTSTTLSLWTAGISIGDLGYYNSYDGYWHMNAGAIGSESIGALAKPVTVTLPASQVANINTTNQTFSLTTPLTDTYNLEFGGGIDFVCVLCTPPTRYTRTITNNATQYYQSLTQNTNGTVTISFYPDFNPDTNILPTDVQVRTELGKDSHDYVEMSRTVTTTTTTDQLISAGTAGVIRAQGSITVNADGGAIYNDASTMTSGGDLVRRATGGSVNDNGIVLRQTGTQTGSSVFYWHQKTDDNTDTQTVNNATVPLQTTTVAALPAIATSSQTVETRAENINIGSVNLFGQTVTGVGVAGGDATGMQPGSVSGNGKKPQTPGGAGVAIPGLVLPSNALYSYNTAPGAQYLVETNPRFTSYTHFISSDYMLNALGLNPQNVEKRLGDAMYEAQLVMNQVTQLTGRTFLGSYTDNVDEYTALMNNGVQYAQSFGLIVGVALTPGQMSELTTDMVWLVSQAVTLPDGTKQTVLVPQLYLSQSNTVDLQDSGALVAGRNVNVNATGDVTNSGHVAGDVATTVIGNNVVNRGVIGSGGTTAVAAVNDVSNIGGRIGGVDTVVTAGNDIVNQSTVAQAAVTTGNAGFTSSATGMAVESVGTISASNSGTLIAGHDVDLTGSAVQTGGDANIAAGHDINVGTTTLRATQDVGTSDGLNGGHATATHNVGSTIATGGNLTMVSGNDMTLTDAQVQAGGNAALIAVGNLTVTAAKDIATYNGQSMGGDIYRHKDSTYDERVQGSNINAGGDATLAAGQAQGGMGNLSILGSSVTTGGIDGATGGALGLQSTGDINVGAVSEEHDASHWSQTKHSGFLSSEKITDTSRSQQSLSVGSTVSGDTVNASAAHDLGVAGSTVASTNDMSLTAGHDLTITTTQDTSQSSTFHEDQKSGFGALSGGGASINYGTSDQKTTTYDSSVTHNGSVVGSIDGSVSMTAGNNLNVTGSDVVAAQNITGTGANVTINAATDTSHHDETHEMKQSGFSLGLAGSVGDAINSAVSQGQAIAGGSGDGRATALHSIAAAGNAAMAGIGAAGVMKGATGPNAPGIGVQLSFGTSQSRSTFSEDRTTQVGSTVQAGGTVSFTASGNSTPDSGNVTIAGSNVGANDVALTAKNAVDIVNTTNTDSTRSSNSSSSASVGVSVTTQGYGVSASMSSAHGDANSDAATQNNAHVTGVNSVTISSGGDTNVIGSDVTGGKVTANVGGNLNVASVQDTTVSAAHQSSTGGGFSISTAGGSASFSAAHGNASGDYAGVNEQAGIQAGAGGFDIKVKGNTDLKGAVIASEADTSKNSLTTGTLTVSDIENHSEYSASSAGITAGGGMDSTGKAVGPGSTPGGAIPTFASDSGSESATTRSAIAQGTIAITDEAHQVQDIASLNRDTSNLNGTVSKLPDVQNLLDQQADLMNGIQAAGQVVAQAIGSYASGKQKDAQDLADAAKKAGDLELAAQYQAVADSWDEGGSSRIALHIAGGALIGGLGGGSIGTAIQGAAGAGLSSAMAKQLDDIYKGVGSATGSELLGNLTANVVAGLGGALVGGTAGATTASNVELYNQSLHRKPKDLVSQACPAGTQCSDAVLNAAIQAQGDNAALASENIKTAAVYGAPAAAVVALGPEAVTAAALAGGLDYAGSIYSYATGLTKDAPSLTNSYIAGIVGALTYPFAIGDAAIAGVGTAGKIAANVYNAGVAGVGAFGTAGMTGNNPDIAAGFASGSAVTGSLVKAMFPGPAGNFLNNLIQGAAGPIQNAVTQGASSK